MRTFEFQRWLKYAYEDLITAKKMLANQAAFPRHICWLAQQSAEKTLKAALIYLSIDFPFTHDLDRLQNLLPKNLQDAITNVDLSELTEWALESRYPGNYPDILYSDAQRAATQARILYNTLENILK